MGHPIPPLGGGASHTSWMEARRRCIPPHVDSAPSVTFPDLTTLGSGLAWLGGRRQRSLPPRKRRPTAELKPMQRGRRQTRERGDNE